MGTLVAAEVAVALARSTAAPGRRPTGVCFIPRPSALALLLRQQPIAPSAIAALLGGERDHLEFRRIVRTIFPGAEAEILGADGETAADREYNRVAAFLSKVEAELFPVYEADLYEHVCFGVPFQRLGWSYERLHDLDMPQGELLLFALCEQPYGEGYDSRIPLLDAVAQVLAREVVDAIPRQGIAPTELHAHLDGTPFAAAAEFADWLWSQTGTAFLDFDDEIEVVDAEWTPEYVQEMARQWRQAETILDRIAALRNWLEEAPTPRFRALLDAALSQGSPIDDETRRRLYALEIAPTGRAAPEHAGDLPDGADGRDPGNEADASRPARPDLPEETEAAEQATGDPADGPLAVRPGVTAEGTRPYRAGPAAPPRGLPR